MKVTQMPPVHAANLVANIGNTAYRVDVIRTALSSKIGALWDLGQVLCGFYKIAPLRKHPTH